VVVVLEINKATYNATLFSPFQFRECVEHVFRYNHCSTPLTFTQGVKKMKWTEIRQKYPNKFILIGDVVEEKISETKYRILEGNILRVSEDGKEIRKAYQQHKKKGMNVLFSLPTTPMDFIIEDVPVKGILR
jgi:hypothetical protein